MQLRCSTLPWVLRHPSVVVNSMRRARLRRAPSGQAQRRPSCRCVGVAPSPSASLRHFAWHLRPPPVVANGVRLARLRRAQSGQAQRRSSCVASQSVASAGISGQARTQRMLRRSRPMFTAAFAAWSWQWCVGPVNPGPIPALNRTRRYAASTWRASARRAAQLHRLAPWWLRWMALRSLLIRAPCRVAATIQPSSARVIARHCAPLGHVCGVPCPGSHHFLGCAWQRCGEPVAIATSRRRCHRAEGMPTGA